jgi:hypothetical protein
MIRNWWFCLLYRGLQGKHLDHLSYSYWQRIIVTASEPYFFLPLPWIAMHTSESLTTIVYAEWFRRKRQQFGRWNYQSLWGKVYMNMCPILNGYRVRAIGVHQYSITVNGITYCSFCSNFNLILQWKICYTDMKLSVVCGSAAVCPFIGHQDLHTPLR